LEWFSDLNGEEDYFAFSFASHKYPIYYKSDEGAGGPKLITKFAFNCVVNEVKEECEGATQSLVSKLENWFPKREVMTTFNVVYLQFWAFNGSKAKASFYFHLNVLKAIFCVPYTIGLSANIIVVLLDIHILDL